MRLSLNSNSLIVIPFLVVICYISANILQFPQYLNTDVAISLQEAILLLKGKIPCVDFVNIQWPFYYYLFVPLTFIAGLLNIPLSIAVEIFAALLMIYCLTSSFVILRNRINTSEPTLILSVLFAFVLLNLVLFRHFCQKEHIFLFTFLPFFFLRWSRQHSDRQYNCLLSIIIGTLAGVGFCLKPPYFPLIPFFLELHWFYTAKKTYRLLTPEIIASLSVFFSYGIWFFIFAPIAMRNAFLTRWMPLTFAGYKAYYCTALQLLSFFGCGGVILPISIAFVCFSALFTYKQNRLVLPLVIWTVIGFIVYLLQQKYWSYLSIPMIGGYFLLANLQLAILAKSLAAKLTILFRQWTVTSSSTIFVFVLYCILLCTSSPFLIRYYFLNGMQASNNCLDSVISSYTKSGDRVLILSPLPIDSYPCLLQMDRKVSTRYLWAFPISMYEFLKCHSKTLIDKSRYKADEDSVIQEIYMDAVHSRPTLIAIDSRPFTWDSTHYISMLTSLEPTALRIILLNYKPIGFRNCYFIWIRKAKLDLHGSTTK